MNITDHAQKRINQRGFSNHVLGIILEHGDRGYAPGGATKIFLGKKEYQKVVGELKRAIQIMDKAKGGNLILQDDCILTVYK